MKTLLSLMLSFALTSWLHGAETGLSSVPFATSGAQFVGGDSITIQEVLATSSNFAVGDRFVVRGTYTLQSEQAAIMGINISTTTPISIPSQATARKQIVGGSGTFEMEYTIQFAGSVYISFSPLSNGASFGRIYLGQGGGTGGPTPTPPTTPPVTPPATTPISTVGLASVPFTTSRAQFVGGDTISIQQVLASSPRMEPGDTVVVRGQYTLQSRADASLMVSLTVNAPGLRTVVAANSRKVISAGSGVFELAYEITQPGSLHVTFYPGGNGGESFGGVYFAAPTPAGAAPNTGVAINNPAANTGKFSNLSVRSLISAGDGTLTAGISVTDQERYVLIRGVGPSLGAFGVTGTLRKPVLSVYGTNGELIATTASWSTAYLGDQKIGIEMLMRSVGAFPLVAGSDDAVLNLRLLPGGYTVSITTGDGQPGAALLEVYASSTFSLPTAP